MKKILVSLLAMFSPALALAQGYNNYGNGSGPGMMWGNNGGPYLVNGVWLFVCIVVASFIFSVIFWLVRNWLNKK